MIIPRGYRITPIALHGPTAMKAITFTADISLSNRLVLARVVPSNLEMVPPLRRRLFPFLKPSKPVTKLVSGKFFNLILRYPKKGIFSSLWLNSRSETLTKLGGTTSVYSLYTV